MDERRSGKGDRRKLDRRKHEYHCITCGENLKHYESEKVSDKEIFWCEGCQQMFVLSAQRMEIPYLAKVKK